MATTDLITLPEYLEALKAHDWYYNYAEGSDYHRGAAESKRLETIAKQSDEHSALYQQCMDIHNAWYRFRTGQGAEPKMYIRDIELPKKDEQKVSLFKQAHELTKQIIRTGDNYRATFGAALKMLYAQIAPTTRSIPEDIYPLVSDGKVFAVEFIKLSTGRLRKMRCRVGVKSHLKGGRKAYDAKSKGLMTVFDMEAGGYRSIPLEGVQRLTVHGQTYSA